MTEKVSDHVEYSQVNGIDVWSVDDMEAALESDDLETAEDHFVEVASDDSVDGVVVEIGNSEALSEEALGHVNDSWTGLAEETDIDGTAYVASGVMRLAVSNQNEADQQTEGFKTVDEAVEWVSSL